MFKCFASNLKDKYGTLVRFFVEISLDITISFTIEILLHAHEIKTMTRFSFISFINCCFMMGCILTLVILGVWVTCCNRHRIEQEEEIEFQSRYEVYWEDQKSPRKQRPLFQIFFILRRMIYASILIIPQAYNVDVLMQVICVVFLNLFSSMYIIETRPFDSR